MAETVKFGFHLAILVLALSGLTISCGGEIAEAIEEIIDEEATTLQEPDIANCSRVINCCDRMAEAQYDSIVPEAVRNECTVSIAPSATAVITEYARERDALASRTDVSEERRESLQDDLLETWQDNVEPGCRCFIEETVGNLPALLLPIDCEFIETSGTLPTGLTCDEAATLLLSTAAGL
jgi:hypothetical protein